MHCLSPDETKTIERRYRHGVVEAGRPRAILYYSSGGQRDYRTAARHIVSSLGAFNEAFVGFSFSITGDGWSEHELRHPHWAAFRQWRQQIGEGRRLYDAPGHVAEPGDIEELTPLLEFALLLGWDATLGAKPGRTLMLFSHDDRLEIHSCRNRRELTRNLLSLGYWRN